MLYFEFPLVIQVPMVTTESGLQYKDIKVGEGPSPPIGFQVITEFLHVSLVTFTGHVGVLIDCSILFIFCHVLGCCKLCCYGTKWTDFRQVRHWDFDESFRLFLSLLSIRKNNQTCLLHVHKFSNYFPCQLLYFFLRRANQLLYCLLYVQFTRERSAIHIPCWLRTGTSYFSDWCQCHEKKVALGLIDAIIKLFENIQPSVAFITSS